MKTVHLRRGITVPPPFARRHLLIILEIANGGCPVASQNDYWTIFENVDSGNNFQYESANGADTSEGFIITNLHHKTPHALMFDMRKWLVGKGFVDSDSWKAGQ